MGWIRPKTNLGSQAHEKECPIYTESHSGKLPNSLIAQTKNWHFTYKCASILIK